MTVRAYLSEWVQLRSAGIRPRTVDCYRSLIRLHIGPAIGDRKLKKIKPKHIAAMLAAIIADGHARTAQLCYAFLHAAFASAVHEQRLDRSPLDGVKRPKHEATRGVAWTEQQTRVFVAAIQNHKHRLAWLLALGMGLRRGEICGLRWSDIDLRARILNVRNQRVRLANGRIIDQPPKSAAGTRALPIPLPVFNALRSSFQWGTGYVVPLTPSALDAAHRTLLKRLDLPYIRLHDLRHTMATNAIRNGATVRVLADVLGHSDPAVTARFYTHTDRELLAKTLDAASNSMV